MKVVHTLVCTRREKTFSMNRAVILDNRMRLPSALCGNSYCNRCCDRCSGLWSGLCLDLFGVWRAKARPRPLLGHTRVSTRSPCASAPAACSRHSARYDRSMENRRCLYCGRKIHPALRPDAKYCGRSCKSSFHRDKSQQSVPSPAPVYVPLAPVMDSLANTVQPAAPPGSQGYILRRQDCPLGSGTFDFPVPMRKTKHANGTLNKSMVYQLWPFEPPRIPWAGLYELLFWVPERGLVHSEDPQRQQIYLGRVATVPRAAFDKHALYAWVPSPDDPEVGSGAYLEREVTARAPAGAIGYMLRINGSPKGPGSFVFPPEGQFSRRANRGLSDVPHYSLKPFELPCVPWAGIYTLSYELENGVIHFNPDPALRAIRIGLIFPYADYCRPQEIQPAASALVIAGNALMLNSAQGIRRAFRQRRVTKK